MDDIKVSIIVPTYNVAPYIRKCLESVAVQTYSGSMECLIVDDCGLDNSIQIAEGFIIDYTGSIDFRIIHRKKNGGLSAARNTGIREAKGKYLYFLDSDDSITPDCIASMCGLVEKYPGVECVFAGANIIGCQGYRWMDYSHKQLPEYSKDRDWIQKGMLERYKFSMTAWNRLISSDFIKKNNLYFEEGFIHEDELWNLVISQVISCAAFLNQNTYNYVIRDNSIITGVKENDKIKFERGTRLINRMLEKVNGYRKGIQSYYIVNYASEYVNYVVSFKKYLVFNGFIFSAICKSNCIYAFKILWVFLKCNKRLLLKFLKISH